MYYGLTVLAVLCACLHIACNKRYLRFISPGNLIFSTCVKHVFVLLGRMLFVCGIAGFATCFTPFAALLAAAVAVLTVVVTVISFKAYGNNVSLFTMFQQMGGMLLPFMYGVVWADNKLTPWRIVGILLLSAALILPSIGKRGKSGITKPFVLLCVGVFLLQGGTNCLMYIHSNSPHGVDAYSFSAMYAAFSVLVSAVLLGVIALLRKRKTATDSVDLPAERR